MLSSAERTAPDGVASGPERVSRLTPATPTPGMPDPDRPMEDALFLCPYRELVAPL